MRRCLVAAGVVCWLTGGATAQEPSQKTGAAARHPQILGTLDPATGKFTADAQAASGGDFLTGTNDLHFNLDATNVKSVSIICQASVNYYLYPGDGSDKIFAGSNRAGPYFPTYHPGQKVFSGVLPIPFKLRGNEADFYRAFIAVVCRYLNVPSAPIFTGTYDVPISPGGKAVGVGGIMDGESY